jgi:hypothetical protein
MMAATEKSIFRQTCGKDNPVMGGGGTSATLQIKKGREVKRSWFR